MILRLLFLCIFVVLLPLILFVILLCGIGFLIFFLLVRFGIINPAFILNSKIFDTLKNRKPFFETSFRQVSCKHNNLEQNNSVLICSDCGKIIQHNNSTVSNF